MTFGRYLLGWAELALIASALGLAAYRIRGRLIPSWTGAPARLAEIVLGVSLLILTSEALGLFGGFGEVPLIISSALVAIAAEIFARRRPAPEQHSLTGSGAPAPGRVAIAIALAAACLVVIHWAIPVQRGLDHGMYHSDSTWYMMPFAAGFAQDGTLTGLHFTDPFRLIVWFFPANSELIHGVGILLFHQDFLSPAINLAWLVLALLAGWCIGRPYGVGAATTVAVAIVFSAHMLLANQPGEARNDSIGLAMLVASLALLVNADKLGRDRTSGSSVGSAEPSRTPRAGPLGGRAPLLLAGLAAGIAAGNKLTLLAPIGAITLGLIVIARRGSRLAVGGTWIAGVLATSGFWFARNLVHAGNPLPWFHHLGAGAAKLPFPDQLPIQPRPRFSIAHYITDGHIWSAWFLPGLHTALGSVWPAVVAAIGLGMALTVLTGRTPLHRMLGVVAVVCLIAYLLTPLTASGPAGRPIGFVWNVRYGAPAMLIALTMLPLAPALSRDSRRRDITLGLLAALLLINDPQLDLWKSGYFVGALLVAALILLVPFALLRLRRGGLRAAAVAGAAIAGLAVLAAAGWPLGRDYVRDRYVSSTRINPFTDPGIRPAFDWARGQSDQRIAVVGINLALRQYLLYGDDLSNRIRYVGAHGPHGALRPITTCAAWRRALNAGDFDYLVSTPLDRSEARPAREALWLRSDPAASEVLRAGPVTVTALKGRLDPGGCLRTNRAT